MKPMVVLFALFAAACGSLVPLVAQPAHHPAIVLDPHGRPLDTAEVIGARALHLQAKALEGHHGALVAPLAHSVVAAPLLGHSLAAAPLLGLGHGVGHGLGYGFGLGHGHLLKKRSLGLYGHSAALLAAPVVSHAVATPLVSHIAAAPVVKYVGGSAVSHQSRVDVRTSPAVVSHSVVAPVVSHSVVAAPVVSAHSAWAAPAIAAHGLGLSGYGYGLGAHGLGLAGHGHLLKKRSLALAHALPAVSHQSRVDVITNHAAPISVAYSAPIAVAHAAPLAYAHAPAVSHQSRVDVISSGAHLAPLAHSAVWTAPAHLSHSGLLHGLHW